MLQVTNTIDQNLKACWQKGYEQILFDTVFVTGVSGTGRATPSLSNRAYDALVEADGERFTISVAMNLRYQSGERDYDTEIRFRHDHDEANLGRKVALLRIEILEFPDSNDGLLVMAAMDQGSRETLSRSTHLLSNIHSLLGHDAIATKTNEESWTSLELADSTATLDKLAEAAGMYRFSIDADPVVDTWRALAFNDLMAELIYRHTQIPLNEDRFVERAYGTRPNSDLDKKIVTLRLETQGQTYLLRAEAQGGARILDVGQVALSI